MIDLDLSAAAGPGSKHQWVLFHNPRNKKVKVTACARCGIAKGPISMNVVCEDLGKRAHRMQKMGWEKAPKLKLV